MSRKHNTPAPQNPQTVDNGRRALRRQRKSSTSNTKGAHQRRLRSRRTLLPAPFEETLVWAEVTSRGVSTRAIVDDISVSGVRLRLDGAHAERALRLGVAANVDVELNGQTQHEDKVLFVKQQATVARLEQQNSDLVVVGLQFESPIDVVTIANWKRWRALERRLHDAVQLKSPKVRSTFKALVADAKVLFTRMQAFFDDEDKALEGFDISERRHQRTMVFAASATSMLHLLNEHVDVLAKEAATFTKEEHARHRAFYREVLGDVLDKGRILRRAQQKPRGYAGDFEMMNQLYEAPSQPLLDDEDLFAKVLDLFVCQLPPAQAVVNRMQLMQTWIERAALSTTTLSKARAKVASIGSGPGVELEEVLMRHPALGSKLDVTFVDQDPGALAHAEQRLSPLVSSTGLQLTAACEDVRALLRDEVTGLEDSQLIYSAGLFDYLDDNVFIRLARLLVSKLAPGGVLKIGNMRKMTARAAMEYMTNWELIYRDETQLFALAKEFAPEGADVVVEEEAAGVNLFLSVTVK